MNYLRKIEWTIIPDTTPQVRRNCPKCGEKAHFINSEKFRVNANGSHIDIWLIYQCNQCKSTWNMTASWGGVGVLWKKNVAFIFIRPQRYTFEFIENGEYLTLSFFDESYKKALGICGSKSGRDVDKMKETGLTPVTTHDPVRSEERRVGKECRSRWSPYH